MAQVYSKYQVNSTTLFPATILRPPGFSTVSFYLRQRDVATLRIRVGGGPRRVWMAREVCDSRDSINGEVVEVSAGSAESEDKSPTGRERERGSRLRAGFGSAYRIGASVDYPLNCLPERAERVSREINLVDHPGGPSRRKISVSYRANRQLDDPFFSPRIVFLLS